MDTNKMMRERKTTPRLILDIADTVIIATLRVGLHSIVIMVSYFIKEDCSVFYLDPKRSSESKPLMSFCDPAGKQRQEQVSHVRFTEHEQHKKSTHQQSRVSIDTFTVF